jgi:CHAT domain-containing protein/Tfp pilus assembly protein PilF
MLAPVVPGSLAGIGLVIVLTATGPSAQTPATAPQTTPSSPQDRVAQLRARVAELEKSGDSDPALATALNDLAVLYFGQGDYVAAEPLLRRAVSIREATLGEDSPATAQSTNNLAQVLQQRGNYVEAETLLERALRNYEKIRGPDHTDVATALNNLAGLYRAMGNYRRAEPLYQRAIAILEKAVGPEHANVGVAVNNLGLMYQQEGDLKKARPLFERSLAIREKALGPDHPDVGRTLNNLAIISQEEGDLANAEILYQRAIVTFEKAFGRTHPLVGTALNNLAVVELLKAQYDKAEPMFEEALAIRRAAQGPSHPDMNRALTSQAIYYDVVGRKDDAIRRQTEATEVGERNLTLILATGSELQKLRYMETYVEDTDITVSMHRVSAPQNPAAGRLAFTTLLRRKGRVLDAMSGTLQNLRSQLSTDDRALLDKLSGVRGQLATLVLRGPGRQDLQSFNNDVRRLEDEVQQIERTVSTRSALYRSQFPDVTIEAVQAALPSDAVLIEIALYRPFDNKVAQRDKRFGAPRYVAYVLRRTGDPASVDLGDATVIDRQVEVLRKALRDPKDATVGRSARSVFEAVLGPVMPLLGDSRRLLISPDGSLNLIPFAALLTTSGRYLLETHEVSYLTSGRDLLRLKERAASSGPPLVVANPEFNARGGNAQGAAAGPGGRAIDFAGARFNPLPGTAAEAAALRGLLPDADVRVGAEATESVVKSAHAPSVLHLATHGFFLGTEQTATVTEGRLLVHDAKSDSAKGSAIDNPLLRSGLAFAGANQREGGRGNDGILTALEASSLDLWGTRMAVLSACETGLGETRRGDGVYGLRRAIVMAGAETLVMSLWQVSDDATRELMTAFYTRLKAGLPRSTALWEVQRDMLRSTTRRHPYYWGSFILSGADGPVAFQ